MKIGIASHIVLDTIKNQGKVIESIGGPPCYCGLTARRFGFDVELATKVGPDFPDDLRNMLRDNNINLRQNHLSSAPTTRFSLETEGDGRQLVLQARCDPLAEQDISDMKVDCWLASPVIDEVPSQVLDAIKRNRGKKGFVMLDPQGYMRQIGPGGRIAHVDNLSLDLSGITALKADQQELAALTGGLGGTGGMKAVQSKGVEFVLATDHRIVHLLHKDMHYWIKLRDIDAPDSTGAGDILAASFACSWIKEKDPVWAICFSAGALKAALETKKEGLGKVPQYSKIETEASYYYNSVHFQTIT
ncbi:MAG: PfkB family carbohydrate kinase [Nitrososphaera sp.]